MTLEGKVVLVTGAGVRLGRAIALQLGQAGARVAVHCFRSRAEADGTAAEVRSRGGQASVFSADLSDAAAAEPLVAAVEAQLGPIDSLVNSAALFERHGFVETPLQSLDRQWAVNARGPYVLTQAVARRMLTRGGGAVVNVLDIGGTAVPWRHYSAYCMTKAAMESLTRCLALELAPAIRVNGVAPGTVLPPESLSPADRQALKDRIPQQRFGTPEDVAQAVLFFLAGPAFITGQVLAVDGGRSLGSATSV